ncbi:MAG: beta galactosidase jelly roll domain-containing protein [Pirellulales bacterium]|nr:beta galactosidase jelly roll domain-containing protein [Pirellulales bacterium]
MLRLSVARCCFCLVIVAFSCYYHEAMSAECSGRDAPPRNRQELKTRLDDLRKTYSPYLRSLPKRLQTRSKDLIGPLWRMKFEVEEAMNDVRPQPPAWFGKDFDDSDWQQVELPEWRYTQGKPREPKSCIVWYRTKFPALPAKPGRRIFLVFDGVDWEAQVWLNSKFLGTHRTYYEPFRFDVTDLLEENNTLAVRILDGPNYGEPIAYWSVFPLVPAKQMRYAPDRLKSVIDHRNGDLHVGNGFGIHRDVYLETTSDPCISAVFARGNPEHREARIKVETDAVSSKDITLGVELIPENFQGKSYSVEQTYKVPKGNGAKTISLSIPNAKVWTPTTPFLYRCRVTLNQDGKIIDSQDVLFGNRSFAIVSEKHPRKGLQAGTLLLNGKPVFLRGSNINGFNALAYWGENDRLIDILLMLKAAGFNSVRSCQHVCFPEVLELMDRLGVMSEQDQGGCRGKKRDAALKQLNYCGKALARTCYNHPGVVLLSFANETNFDPTDVIREVLKVDPDRIITPISGNPHGGDAYPHKGKSTYKFSDDLWANVVGNFHPYRGWYAHTGQIWKISKRLHPDRMVLVGEFGGEALDGYETMANNYPSHFRPTPPADADTLWGHVQVKKTDRKQITGFRGRIPKNLAQYIQASQNYQADIVTEVTAAWRLSPRRVCGYFHFHFIDILPANWPKSIVSHDLCPKKAYYAIAQLNQPTVPLCEIVDQGKAMGIWVANDLDKSFDNCRIDWSINRDGKKLIGGNISAHVPALNASLLSKVDIQQVPKAAEVVIVRLILSDSSGKIIACYEREVFLRGWREEDAIWSKADKK